MTFDLAKILESKREFRRRLAARPIAEKLKMLDALRERELTLRASQNKGNGGEVHEAPLPQPNAAAAAR
ncbi:MAG: hypothetical protein H7A46_22595 [Verrucomicrobiales bacterium]|nr:hypothetical protein [Verrucomicrobiales bacterium]